MLNILSSLSFLTSLFGVALTMPPADDATPDLSIKAKASAISTLTKEMDTSYVFPDVGKKACSYVLQRFKEGVYDDLDGDGFAKQVTTDLQSIAHDKHLRVRFFAEPLPDRANRGEPTEAERKSFDERVRQVNGAFENVQRLEGNVGYIDFRQFAKHPVSQQAAKAAFSFVNNTDALIIDMRQNGGGDPAMVAWLCGFLLGPEKVHVNDIYFRPTNETQQFFTTPSETTPRYDDKPVYVLTSSRTFSGAEEFTYDLKTLKRATVVGEVTGGGANPGGGVKIGEHLMAFVPVGRAINPITKTNWEGVGVKPDIECPADKAMRVAQVHALKRVREKVTDANRQKDLDATIARLEKG